jgi:hypothetical protein
MTSIPSAVFEWPIEEYRISNLKAGFRAENKTHIKILCLTQAAATSNTRLRPKLSFPDEVVSLDLTTPGLFLTKVAMPISMNQLTHLSVTIETLATLLLDWIQTPVLTSLALKVTAAYYYGPYFEDRFKSFTTMSRLSGILHLSLAAFESCHLTKKFYTPLLLSSPMLQTFELHGRYHQELLKEVNKSKFLPKMKILILRETDVDYKVISDLVDSRSAEAGLNPIEEVVLDHCTNINRAFCEEIAWKLQKLAVYI